MDKLNEVAAAIARETGSQDLPTCLRAARAAVLALREPSVEMLEAAMPDVPDWGYLPEEWQKMIDFVVR